MKSTTCLSDIKFASDECLVQDILAFMEEHSVNECLHVFAYASLMWNPCFSCTEKFVGRISGYRRGLCISSIMYRGTLEKPGIVMGLEKEEGCECEGVIFKLCPDNLQKDMKALWKREMVSGAYIPAMLPIVGRPGLKALAFVAAPEHPQYEPLPYNSETAQRILTCHGSSGSNLQYFEETLASINRLGIKDEQLTAFAARFLPSC